MRRVSYKDYLKINKNIFITPQIGYLNAKFVDSGEYHKILCYTIDGILPVVFNPIRYFNENLVGNTLSSAQAESNTYISLDPGVPFDNRDTIPALIEDKCYGNIELKQSNIEIPDNNILIVSA